MSETPERSRNPFSFQKAIAKVRSGRVLNAEPEPGPAPPPVGDAEHSADGPGKYIGEVRRDPVNRNVVLVWDGEQWINPDELHDVPLPDRDSVRSAARRLAEAE
jgi:hypothetical protein